MEKEEAQASEMMGSVSYSYEECFGVRVLIVSQQECLSCRVLPLASLFVFVWLALPLPAKSCECGAKHLLHLTQNSKTNMTAIPALP